MARGAPAGVLPRRALDQRVKTDSIYSSSQREPAAQSYVPPRTVIREWPPLTEDMSPPAVFRLPPLTEEKSPRAVHSLPPLTEEWGPHAVLWVPPLTEE